MIKYKIEHALDSPERSIAHGEIIKQKYFLRKLYQEWYSIIESIEYLNPFTYLFSGGVSRRQLLPDFSYPALNFFDKWLPKISKHLSMFMVVKISCS